MRTSVAVLVGAMVLAGCGAPAATAPPSTPAPTATTPPATPAPTAAPLAIGEFTSHGVAAKLDARGAGANVTGTMTLSDSGLNATVALECSRTTDSGLLLIGGLVTDSTFTENFPKGHRVAIVLQPGSPVKSVWYVVMPGDKPVASCKTLLEDNMAGPLEGLEPIVGTVQLAG